MISETINKIVAEPIMEYYGFSKLPFPKIADPRQAFLYPEYVKKIKHLEQILLTREIGVVVGEAGTGKTSLFFSFKNAAIEQSFRVIEVLEPSQKKRELYRSISQGLGVNVTVQGADALKVVNLMKYSYLESNRPNLLLIDEAHNLSVQCLEELRIMTNLTTRNEPLLALVLFGQPLLASNLKSPAMLSLAQRIHVWQTMNCLNNEDALGYIDWQLNKSGGNNTIFTEGTKKMLVRRAKGNARMIGRISWECLYQGFVDQVETITEEFFSFVCQNLPPHLVN